MLILVLFVLLNFIMSMSFLSMSFLVMVIIQCCKYKEFIVQPATKAGDVVLFSEGTVHYENSKTGDLEVNASKAKETSNIRTVNKEEKLYVPPPKQMTIEELIGYMNEDEVIEVTPKSVRLRKAELDSGVRERMARTRKKQMMAAQQNKNK